MRRHKRDWRYHIEEKVWITRMPDQGMYNKNGVLERGSFFYFDPTNWRRMPKDFLVDQSKLDKCPNLSVVQLSSGQSV